MSADNGYVLRRNAEGKFALQEYSASADEFPLVEDSELVHDTLEEAVLKYEEIATVELVEYGLTTQIGPSYNSSKEF